jgi:uncharacterized protein (DUF697 family)
MAVIGTVVANVVANIDKFESGMKRAASIHQSTVKQISSGQMLNGYRNADDWWKGITSAQRSSNSQYASELESALEGTQRRIAASGVRTGQSLAKSISDGVTSGLTGKAGGFSGMIQQVDNLLENVAVRAAGKIAGTIAAASMFVEGDNFMRQQRYLNKNGKQLADMVFGREIQAAKLPGLLADSQGIAQQLRESNSASSFKANESLMQTAFAKLGQLRSSNLLRKNDSGQLVANEAEIANIAYEKATGQKGAAFKSVNEARLALSGFNASLIDTARAATAGGLSMIPLIGEGLGGMIAPNAPTQFDIELQLNKFDEFFKEGKKQANEINKSAKELDAAIDFATLKRATTGLSNALGKNAIARTLSDIGKVTPTLELALNKGNILAGKAEAWFQGVQDNNRLREQFIPSFALGQELQRIDAEKSKGFLDDETANVMRGAARQRFISQLGSGFNQTQLFGAMERNSSAAISAINQIQNRSKSPEEMNQEEQLIEAKRQTQILIDLGKKALMAKGADL